MFVVIETNDGDDCKIITTHSFNSLDAAIAHAHAASLDDVRYNYAIAVYICGEKSVITQ